VLTGLTLSACRPRSESAGGKANVVIFLVDTLRADRLGSYGYGGGTSPYIDALGDAGVVFEQASAPAPWTLPSVASLLLSALPCEHNVLVDNDKIDGSARPLAALFKEAGYKTASFYTNPYAGEMSGLERGFDLSQHMVQQVDGRVVSSWLDGSSEAPFFLYIHNTEPHNPYHARPRFTEPFGQVSGQTRKDVEGLYRRYRSLTRADYSNDLPVGSTDNSVQQDEAMRRLRSLRSQIDVLYDAAILEADNNVGGVIAALRQAGVWDETLSRPTKS
jgi:arylsulfatase A-like enzyme